MLGAALGAPLTRLTAALFFVATSSIGVVDPPNGIVDSKSRPPSGISLDLIKANPPGVTPIEVSQVPCLMKSVIAGKRIINTASHAQNESILPRLMTICESVSDVFWFDRETSCSVGWVILFAWEQSGSETQILAPIKFTFIGVQPKELRVAPIVKVNNRPNIYIQRGRWTTTNVFYCYREVDRYNIAVEIDMCAFPKIDFDPGSIGGDQSVMGYYRGVVGGRPEIVSGFPQREREPSNNEGSDGGEKTIVPVNGPDQADKMFASDFSDDEAILIWLAGCIIGIPIVYAFSKWSGNILFNDDERKHTKSDDKPK